MSHQYAVASATGPVFSDISFAACRNQVVSLIGESGSGKTTLLLACGAMLKPTGGSIHICDVDILSISSSSRTAFRAARIGYLFQTLQLVPYLNVLDNLILVKGVNLESAKNWLDRLGLSRLAARKPEALSQGERQRAALARAIVHTPSLLIADEPTGNLDPVNSELVFRTLREFADEGGTVLVASHDHSVQKIADQRFHLIGGSLLPMGATE